MIILYGYSMATYYTVAPEGIHLIMRLIKKHTISWWKLNDFRHEATKLYNPIFMFSLICCPCVFVEIFMLCLL